MDGLDGILNDVEPVEVAPEPELHEEVQPDLEPEPQDTGEEVAAPPAEVKEAPKAKGIEAALIAERRKRQELEHRLQQLTQPKQQEAQQPKGEPQPAEFQTYEAYLAELARYNADQRWEERQRTHAEQEKQKAEQSRQMDMERAAFERIAQGQAKYADFDAVINDGLAPFLTPALHEAIVTADGGHEVAYYLGKNPAEAARIAQLSERAQARELGRLEERLLTQAAKPIKPTIPQTLTQTRDTRGQFAARPDNEPTTLDAILAPRR